MQTKKKNASLILLALIMFFSLNALVSATYLSDSLSVFTSDVNITKRLFVQNITLHNNCVDGEVLKWSGGVGKCGTDSTSITYISSATGAGIANTVSRWVNTTHLNSSGVLYDSNGALGIGDSTPSEAGARLVICCGVTAQASNMTIISNLGVNYGSEVKELRVPSTYNTGNPSYFRWYMQLATGDSAFGIIVNNATGATRQLLTVDGAYNAVGIGDDSISVDNAAFKVMNLHNKNYPVLVTNAADSILFRVNNTGAIALATTATLGIGTGTTANQNEVKLQVQGGTSGTPFNATLLYASGVNHGGEVKLLFSPSIYNINRPAYIRSYFSGAVGESLFGFVVTNSTGENQLLTLDGNNNYVGIMDTTPSYPLEVNKAGTGGISIYALGNVSATGYITRTDVYDKATSALDEVKDSSEYKKSNGKIDHKSFGYSYVNYTRTEFDPKTNMTVIKYEEGVDLVKEVSMLKQALYEAKVRIEILENQK